MISGRTPAARQTSVYRVTPLYIDNIVYTPFVFAVPSTQCIQERANYSRVVIIVALSLDAVCFPSSQMVDFSRGILTDGHASHIISYFSIYSCDCKAT